MNDCLAAFTNGMAGVNLAAAWNANGTTLGGAAPDWPVYPPPAAGVITNDAGEVLVTDTGERIAFA